MQKFLLITGLLLIAAALLWPFLAKLPIGRLPGDIIIDKPGFKVCIPLTTMILLSIVLSVILWIFRR
ncbi:MAG: DUF2905 domain-containing protein [Desulfosalsimonadaceae bacterium]